MYRSKGLGFRVQEFGLRVWGLGFRNLGLGFGVNRVKGGFPDLVGSREYLLRLTVLFLYKPPNPKPEPPAAQVKIIIPFSCL